VNVFGVIFVHHFFTDYFLVPGLLNEPGFEEDYLQGEEDLCQDDGKVDCG